MGSNSPDAVAKSVNDRLKTLSRKEGFETRILQVRYALGAFLRRLQNSPYAGRFVLKGGMLMLATGDQQRPTEDADLQGIEIPDGSDILQMIKDIAEADVLGEDGVRFDFSSTKVTAIREGFIPGCRVVFDARIGPSPVRMKFDICFGDAIFPAPIMRNIPDVLGGPPVSMLCYPWETVVAEKLHAMVEFGLDATRIKDFYDLAVIARLESLNGYLATEAIRSCFGQRGTAIDPSPVGLTDEFVEARSGEFDRWISKRGPFRHAFGSLEDLINEIRPFIIPLCEAAAGLAPPPGDWMPGEGWEPMHRVANKHM